MADVISSRHLKTFSDHFEAFSNMYVLIGGVLSRFIWKRLDLMQGLRRILILYFV